MRTSYALMQGGRIYTLNPVKHYPGEPKSPFHWRGYCDGDPCGFFKTKKDFEEFVKHEPAIFPEHTPQARASMRAQTLSTFEGNQILHKLTDALKRKKQPS